MTHLRHKAVTLALLLLACPALTSAAVETRLETWHDAARDRDVPVKFYLPSDLKQPAPVVVFSPGLGGSRLGYSYLGEAWAAHGYVVVVLEHVGSNAAVFKGGDITIQSATSPKEFIARAADVHFAIDQLEALNRSPTDPLAGKLDLAKLALGGHSYGAITTQAIVGQTFAANQTLTDPRVKCGIIMSPSPPTTLRAVASPFGSIKVPLLHLTGTLDDSPIGGAKAKDRRTPFDQITAKDQTLIIFNDADHMVFAGAPRLRPEKEKLDAQLHPLIEEITTRYLDAHLRADATAADWLATHLKAAVGPSGTVEQK